MYKFTGISISPRRGIKKKRVNEPSIENEICTNEISANEIHKNEISKNKEIYTNEAYTVKYKGETRSRGLLEKVPLIT